MSTNNICFCGEKEKYLPDTHSYLNLWPDHLQSDQCLHCPHEQTMHPWLSKMSPVKILIRLFKCAG